MTQAMLSRIETVRRIKASRIMTDPPGDDSSLRKRRGEISAYGRALRSWFHFQCLTAIALLVIFGLTLIAVVSGGNTGTVASPVMLLLSFSGLFAIATMYLYARRNFVEPDRAFRKWLQQVCDGDTEAKIDLPEQHAHFRELDFHTKNLGQAFTSLTTDMDELVGSQTTRLEQQNRSLELLFNLTADVAKELDQITVLETVCLYLSNWFGESHVRAYLVDTDGETRLAASRSCHTEPSPINNQADETESSMSSNSIHQLSESGAKPTIRIVRQVEHELNLNGPFRHRTSVPVLYGVQVGALIVIDSTVQYPTGKHDTLRVLRSISEQLSLFEAKRSAIDKSKVAEATRERIALAGDIHDSLAQTLTAVRYQVDLLEESLGTSTKSDLRSDFERLKGTIDEANLEVRGLIGEYRKPLMQHRSTDAIRETVDQLQRKTDARLFFQVEDPQLQFSQREESQLQRIVGEALNNAIKYSEASIIRVYVGSNSTGVRRVLIEDDGNGFDTEHCRLSLDLARPGSTAVAAKPRGQGEHIGLSIMHERATTIGARLGIESEPGEGTRVSIELPPASTFG